MKRITLLWAAIICLVMSAMAQDEQPLPQQLTPEQWKHGVAVCAHYTAYARGFGKKTEDIEKQYTDNYAIDDIDRTYKGNGRRWESIYKNFKGKENTPGTLDELKEMVTPQVWRNMVEPDMRRYLTSHPAGAQPVAAVQPADGEAPQQPAEGGPDQQNVAQGPQGQPGQPGHPGDGMGPRHDRAGGPGACHGVNWPLWLGILGTLLGLIALINSIINRNKINKMRRAMSRELERTNGNLQQLATDCADQVKALSIRLTGREALRRNQQQGNNRPAQAQQQQSAAAAPLKQQEKRNENTQQQPRQQQQQPKQQQQQPKQQPKQEQQPKQQQQQGKAAGGRQTVFLSRPDENDNFVRATPNFEPGNSIYVLTTADGKQGTFQVIDDAKVHRFALMMPAENLMRACSGNAIQIPNGTRIVTDRPGEAVLENGKWHVSLKAIIHYEG